MPHDTYTATLDAAIAAADAMVAYTAAHPAGPGTCREAGVEPCPTFDRWRDAAEHADAARRAYRAVYAARVAGPHGDAAVAARAGGRADILAASAVMSPHDATVDAVAIVEDEPDIVSVPDTVRAAIAAYTADPGAPDAYAAAVLAVADATDSTGDDRVDAAIIRTAAYAIAHDGRPEVVVAAALAQAMAAAAAADWTLPDRPPTIAGRLVARSAGSVAVAAYAVRCIASGYTAAIDYPTDPRTRAVSGGVHAVRVARYADAAA